MKRPKRLARRLIGRFALAGLAGGVLWWTARSLCGAGDTAGLCGWDTIERVEVRGTVRLNADQVRAWAAVPLGAHLWTTKGEQLVARLEGRPWVKAVTITKRFPDTLVIEVAECVPAAVAATDRGRVLVDADGWAIGPASLAHGFPVIVGASTSRPERLRLAARILAGFRAADVSLAPIDSLVIDVANPDDPVVRLPDGIHVRIGRGGFVEKWRRVQAIADNATERIPSPRLVDLRFPDRAVVTGWDRAL
ncbi:MAG: FtsQ-type POTRA domain-containing protein [Nitrospirota bacterium]